MARTIKIPFGQIEDRIVHVSEVPAGKECGCKCVSCGHALTAKKGQVKVHHFAHAHDAECRESVLHKLGKRFLRERVDKALQEKSPLAFTWECIHCGEQHAGDLTKNAVRCLEEEGHNNIRPDLSLFDRQGRMFAGIEVVVTHEPDAATRKRYEEMQAICIEFHLTSGEDLQPLHSDEVLRPSRVEFCLMPRCPSCRAFLLPRRIHVVEGSCWKCGRPMKISFGERSMSMMLDPDEYHTSEVSAARDLGAKLEKRYSRTVNSTYLANVCPSCDALTGSHYLHDFYHLADTIPAVLAAYECPKCERIVRK